MIISWAYIAEYMRVNHSLPQHLKATSWLYQRFNFQKNVLIALATKSLVSNLPCNALKIDYTFAGVLDSTFEFSLKLEFKLNLSRQYMFNLFLYSSILKNVKISTDPLIYTQSHTNIITSDLAKPNFASMSGTVEICMTCYGHLILQVVLAYAAVLTLMQNLCS